MPEFTTLDRIDPRGKTVLVRVDLNVPMKDGRVTDRTRIDRAAATLRELAERGGRVIVLSHFGRPKGKDPVLSLQPLIQPLSEAIGRRGDICRGRALHERGTTPGRDTRDDDNSRHREREGTAPDRWRL